MVFTLHFDWIYFPQPQNSYIKRADADIMWSNAIHMYRTPSAHHPLCSLQVTQDESGTTVHQSCLPRAHSWAGRTDSWITGGKGMELYSSGVKKMLWQLRIKSKDSGRGHGSREGRGSAEKMTFELGFKG